MRARRGAVALSKAFENEWQDVRSYAHARVADDDLDVLVHSLKTNSHVATSWRELHSVQQQIPNDLPEAIRVAVDGPDSWIEHALQPNPFRLRRGSHGIERRF